MDFAFKTIHQFNDFFKDELTCYRFYEQQRWADGKPVCPHCGSAKAPYTVKPRGKFQDIPSYRCSERECKLPFTVRTGIIFEGSKVELRKWFQAAYEITTSKKGISSVELATRIGVSQKTAWFINHRLRNMLNDAAPELLSGVVEVDETYIGGKEKNKKKSVRAKRSKHAAPVDNKTPIVGLLERGGNVRLFRMVKPDQATLIPLVKANVAPGSVVVTDGWHPYKVLKNDYEHVSVNHAQDEWVKGAFHTNSLEGFWGLFKRGIIGIYHSVSPQHLERYCAEFSTRYNQRKTSNIDRFLHVVNHAGKERITYRVLTSEGKPNETKPE
jgi:transposase-like protein